MTNVIDFLERLGQDASLRYATRELIEEALCNAGVELPLRAAIVDRDQRALEALLGADTNVCCMVHKEDEEEEEEEDDDDDDEDEEDEAVLDHEVRSRQRADRAA